MHCPHIPFLLRPLPVPWSRCAISPHRCWLLFSRLRRAPIRPGLVHSGPSRAQHAQHIITLERMLLAVILEHLYG